LGNIAGNYQVLARLYTPKGNPHGIPLLGAGTIEVIPPKKPIKPIKTELRKPPKLAKALAFHSESAHVLFQVTARGVDIVSAAHNGNPAAPDLFGTFIQNIKASNTFTANVVPSSGFLDVSFDLGTVLVKGTGSAGVFTSPALEMSTLAPGMNTLLVRARTSAGAFSDTASVWVLPFPGWVSPLQNIVTSFVLEFQPAKDRYHAGFSWPIDFVWSQAVDTAVLLLGGEKNDANLQFNANAFFYLNESSSFDASGGYKTTIFGHPLDLAAALNGSFNSSFKFLGGDGLFESTMDFEFPDKSISKTMLVYGVPVTAALEVGGDGHVTLNGNATLGSDLAFKKVLVVPGIDVTLSATASVAAVYGLAKIGVNASPLTEVQLKLLYTSIVPHLKTTFGGRLTVPVKLIGSIFWGLGKGTLASTTLGPYAFGSMVGSKAKMMRTPFALGGQGNTVIPEFIPSSSIAVDAFGRQMVVFTKDVDPVVGAVNPDVYYRYFNGSQWLAAAPVATEANFWEMDPDVTFLSGGAALALWTSNDGAKTLANLNDIFAHQDIRYALWNGSQWGAPGYVFKDTYADGVPALSYDAVNKKSLAVWLHDVNSDRDLNTRHEWDIYSAVFDEVAGNWSAVTNLSGADGYADYMPQVDARAGWGMAVWTEDVDGQFFTALPQITNGTNVSYANNDGVVRYALFNGSSWNASQTVPGSNSGFVAFSEVAWNGDASKAVVVWVGKRDSTTRAGTVETQIYYAVFTRATNQWTVPKVVGAAGISNKENLRVMVDASGVATIIWKGRGINGTDGDLYKTTLDLATDAYSSVVAMTRTSEAEVGFSSAMDGYGRVQAVWQRQDFAGGSDLSSAGMSGGLSLGQIGLQRAHFLGSIADHGIDVDGDGTLDLLRISVDFYAQPGSFLLSGQLADGYGNTFASAKTVVSPVASGLLRAALDFPAQVVAEHGLDGPYVLRNLRLDDLNNGGLLADVYSQQISTYGYALTDFGRGYVSFDRAAYDDLRNTTATITVRDAYANNSASVVDRVAVQVSSDLYAVAGITLTLTETGVDTGIFQGVLRFSQVVTNATTGEVQVADGSTVTVIYTDTKGVIRQSLATWSKGVTYISLDVDGNGVSNANDGVMILRRLNGAGTVTTGIVLPQGITNASVVGAIDQGGTGFDVDGDGDADANDGVMILRRMNGAGTVTTGIVLPANVGGVGGFGERTNGEVNGAIDGLR